MAGIDPRMMDLVWTDRVDYEALYHKRPIATCTVAEPSNVPATTKVSNISQPKSGKTDLAAELESIRGFIKASLDNKSACPVSTQESLLERASRLERSNESLKKLVNELTCKIDILESKAQAKGISIPGPSCAKPAAKPAAKPVAQEESDEDSDEEMMFGDDDNAKPKEETALEKAKRLAKENQNKPKDEKKKKVVVGKSNLVLDVKPESDETDLEKMEELVRSIEMDGLVWGTSQLVDVCYGIQKLRIQTAIVDDLVVVEDLENAILAFEDHVQSVDQFSFNKI